MTPTLSYVDQILSYLALTFSIEHTTVIAASYKNDIATKFHIPLLILSHKESNLKSLDVEAVDSQTL